ncbi:uncharacterized protein SPPG_05472 [Spizellomyces punctatus DAOM BR117]|uniref:F-box domain-containing protein n=1 Tax=Spizellomyces punctatus (strain DAOM BR117) TaxID=645134 RepID=A0A0L0HDX4_SPIPD|nr:uncharacterized protein SPPG_05472 [Spizellomyces punctatus DAOM BR117]KNC99216.1 hypothetical protein SPPG_05472 [Spizellomyces punctatus DAOM BR117]|eukprot:XP_016607256.1 hypothetical protein SPPG_05472 [Spizellomyces punctatus DAOM BR117]
MARTSKLHSTNIGPYPAHRIQTHLPAASHIAPSAECCILSIPRSIEFYDLPPELRIRIFRFLEEDELRRCLGVCRQWRNDASDGSLWGVIDLKRYTRPVSEQYVKCLVKRAGTFLHTANFRNCNPPLHLLPSITHLSLVGCHSVTSYTLSDFLSVRNTVLQTLNLSSLQCIGTVHLLLIGLNFPGLQDLDVGCCPGVDDKGLVSVVRGCKQLRRFRSPGCINVGDEGVQALMGLATLTHLNISHCSNVTNLARSGRSMLTHLQLSTLQRLALQNFYHLPRSITHLVLSSSPHLTDIELDAISRLPLSHLDLDSCGLISDRTAHYLCAHQTKDTLSYLSLASTSVTAAGICTILRYCSNMQHLDVTSTAANDSVLKLLGYLHAKTGSGEFKLRCVEVVDCVGITKEAVLRARACGVVVKSFWNGEGTRAGSGQQSPGERQAGEQRRRVSSGAISRRRVCVIL